MGLKCVASRKSGSTVVTLGVALLTAVGCQSGGSHEQQRVVADRGHASPPPGQHHYHPGKTPTTG